MCSLAASGFRVKVGQTQDGYRDQEALRETGDHYGAA
jgi:hypothetical protein